MKKHQRIILVSLMIVSTIGLSIMAGCDSGSPPSQVMRTVVGQVLQLNNDGSTTGVEGVTVTLQGDQGQFEGVTTADGTFAIEDVISGATYDVAIDAGGQAVSAGALNPAEIPIGDPETEVTIDTIYVTPTPPDDPGL